MIRKIMFILAALAMVASGVAAVSAYEAHLVNVTAKVENALNVSTVKTDFGAYIPQPGFNYVVGSVFPEEWLSLDLTVDLSGSFKQQTRVKKVKYIVCAEKKPNTHPGDTTAMGSYTYLWMGGAAYYRIDGAGSYNWIGPTADIVPPTGATCNTTEQTLDYTTPGSFVAQVVNLYFDVPVFADYYNADTDVCDKLRPDTGTNNPRSTTRTGTVDGAAGYCQVPSVKVNTANTTPTGPGLATGTNFGMDAKIQVTSIGN